MPLYMTQPMQSGNKKTITYYRRQSRPDPGHTETEEFTQDAVNIYCDEFNVDSSTVEKGAFKSDQSAPSGGIEI